MIPAINYSGFNLAALYFRLSRLSQDDPNSKPTGGISDALTAAPLRLKAAITEQGRGNSFGICLCRFPGPSDGGGKQEDLDEGHHFQGGQVGEDGLQRARKAEQTLGKG